MPQTDGIGIDEMWWTVITLTAVAGWFEWVYRHDRGRGKAEKDSPDPSSPDDMNKVAEPEQSQN